MIDNIFVFLSHSHHDFDKVCQLRNLLEKEGFKPLMFFLKAFENPKYEHLLKPIIKEEIDQRQRFILCRSENTKESTWVKFEEDYIKSKGRPYEIVDLDSPKEIQQEAVRNYRRRSRVFISSPRSLSHIVYPLTNSLKERGFITFEESLDIKPGELITETIANAIDKAATEGYVLYLIDSDHLSKWQETELYFAIQKSARVIPVWVVGTKLSNEVLFAIGNKLILDVHNLPINEQVSKIVQHLIRYDLQFNAE